MCGELGLKTWNCFPHSLEQLVPPDPSGFGADLGTSPTLLMGTHSSGRWNNRPPVIRFVSLRAGGRAELPVCQKTLVEINTVVLVEVPGSRDGMQAAVSMEMPWLQEWAGAGHDHSFQGFSRSGRAVGGRHGQSGVPDSWDFCVFHPCVTFPAALEFVCSTVNNTFFYLILRGGGFSKVGEPFPALLRLLGREMGWEQEVVV